MTSDIMPAIAIYRGQRIHAFQSKQRIKEIVTREIDCVLDDLVETDELLAFAGNLSHSPEARLVAARRLLDDAGTAERNRRRATVDREQVAAMVAGLDSLRWADPSAYNSLLLVAKAGEPQPAPRPAEDRRALEGGA